MTEKYLFLYLYLLPMPLLSQAQWSENLLVNFSKIIASGNHLTNCWICHDLITRSSSYQYILLRNFSLNLTFGSGIPEGQHKSVPLQVSLANSAYQVPCLDLTPPLNQSYKTSVYLFNCSSLNQTCCPCPRGHCDWNATLAEEFPTPTIQPMSFSSSGCHPNLTHWCPAGDHPVNNPDKSLQNRCTAWEGKELITWRVLYSLPKAHTAHIWPKSTALQGGPLSPTCNQTIQTGWKSHLHRWFNTKSPRWACTPPGYVFLCGPKLNKLPFEGSPKRTYSNPPLANLFTCINNIQHVGECAVGLLGPRGIGVTIYNTTQPRQRRALGLILAGIGATVGMIAPWGGFAYHEITLRNLSTQIGNLAKSTGDAISKLKASLDSLANVVMDNRLALDYLLAEQGGVCAVINKSCCTYVNNSGAIEEDIKKIYDHATWLHEFGKGDDSEGSIWKAVTSALPSHTWLVPLLGPATLIFFLLLFGPCLYNLLIKCVSSRIRQFHTQPLKMESHHPIVLGRPSTYKFISPLDASGQRFRETTEGLLS
uniref:Envelope protein ENVV1 n=1 Tax=Pithecia pithecia TaxID=43777 RepID=M9QRG8_PITPI|nr:envelope protein ENVV1 [Pithecia pithecia]